MRRRVVARFVGGLIDTLRLACFVSPHGFGHAARASAVMEALHRIGGARFELFSASPRWFFDESISGLYSYHRVVTDVGLHQRSALGFDLGGTVAALEGMLPFDETWLAALAKKVGDTGCRAVLCDIAPLGVAVAERAGVPSLLVENFTWPWLYEPLIPRAPALEALSEELARWLGRATWHVQTDPLCEVDADADLRVPPIGRRPRTAGEETRVRLGLRPDARVVLITMGGVPQELPSLDRLMRLEAVDFVVTGVAETRTEGNLHLFDNNQRIYLPDLVRASDAVVAKLGYSTLAEAWGEGRPMAWVTRSDFRETGPLRSWAERELVGFEIRPEQLHDGSWTGRIPELLDLEGTEPNPGGGADPVARFVLEGLEADDEVGTGR